MHMPYDLDAIHPQARINTFFQEAEQSRLWAEARRGRSEPWLASLASQARAAARRAAEAISSPAAKPSEPAEQCC